ncbi:hypothetical protein BGZ83_000310 [Gryganskiella cystojenkinii]|nr:hypothetical protein BGZ83_000310 [Gryganskiella cystojenkinii]
MTKRQHLHESRSDHPSKTSHQPHKYQNTENNTASLRDAFSVPEIILLISQFFDQKTLVHSLRINRVFYNTLLSRVWSKVHLSLIDGDDSIPFPVFDKHTLLIQELTVVASNSVNFLDGNFIYCPNLSILHVTQELSYLYDPEEDEDDESTSEEDNDTDDDEDNDVIAEDSVDNLNGDLNSRLLPSNITQELLSLYNSEGMEDYDEDSDNSDYDSEESDDPEHAILANQETLIFLIQRHQATLKDLSFNNNSTRRLLRTLIDCPILERLSIRGMQSNYSFNMWLEYCNPLWSRLRALTLTECMFDDNDLGLDGDEYTSVHSATSATTITARAEVPPIMTRLQEIDVFLPDMEEQSSISALLRLIQRSPDLILLRWMGLNTSEYHRSPMFHLAKKAWTKELGCQKLQSLSLPYAELEEGGFQVLLEGLPALKKLDLSNTSFGNSLWRVLKESVPRYLTELTELNLQSYLGEDLHDILCSISSLQVFKAQHIRGVTLSSDSRSWVCLGLKSLTLAFFQTEAGDQSLFFNQLSRLERLEHLDLKLHLNNGLFDRFLIQQLGTERNAVDLTLNQGGCLNQLVSLKKLRSLTGSDKKLSPWTGTEARWVLSNWKRLEKLSGIYLDDEAESILKEWVDIVDCHSVRT